MAWRDQLREKPAIGAGVALVLLGLAGVFAYSRMGPRNAPQPFAQGWYFDVKTGDLFAARNVFPPVEAPSGADQGVRAYVYSCGTCEPSKWTIAYLETHTPEARQIMLEPADGPDRIAARNRAMTEGRLIAAAPAKGESPQWIASHQPAAQQLVANARPQCPQGEPILCAP